MPPTLSPLGDHAVTIAFGDKIDDIVNQQVLSFFYYLKEQNIVGVKDILPTYASVTVVYDIMIVSKMTNVTSSFDHMCSVLQEALTLYTIQSFSSTNIIRIPVCYDNLLGTDLNSMAEQKNMTIADVIALHCSTIYRVYMTGFLPGFAYMGIVPDEITMARKPVPTNVAAGSVGIADSQTGIYPFDSPGGWNIIGRTPLKLFDRQKEKPCLLQPGDMVKFEPISLEEFYQLKHL